MYVKVSSELMNFPLGVSPSKEMGDRSQKVKKKSPTSVGIEHTISVFDRPLLYRLSYETSRVQVVDDYGGNCGNVNVQGTNECCAAKTKDTNDRSQNYTTELII